VSQQRLVSGTPVESFLGIAPSQIHAIVRLTDGTQRTDATCSGSFLSASWLVTSGHCRQLETPVILVDGSSTTLSVLLTVTHPRLDVALMNVAGAEAAVPNFEPLDIVDPDLLRLSVGDAVELAGYGITEEGVVDGLRFLIEPVTKIEPDSLTVSGFGASGACDGDSGGPLLVRQADGSVAVAGVLSNGSATCTQDDTYVRLDAVSDWAHQVMGAGPLANRNCGFITSQGRCLYGSAVWCSGSQLSGEPCGGTSLCGWDGNAQGFRCVEPSRTPCAGVDGVGRCNGQTAISCLGGALVTDTCGMCEVCRVDGKTGTPYCSAH